MVMLGNTQAQFSVKATHEASTLSRILEFFALNDITPSTLHANKLDADYQRIEVTCSDIDTHRAEVIANKIRQLVSVRTANLELTYLKHRYAA